jgi:hypothetical protein
LYVIQPLLAAAGYVVKLPVQAWVGTLLKQELARAMLGKPDHRQYGLMAGGCHANSKLLERGGLRRGEHRLATIQMSVEKLRRRA